MYWHTEKRKISDLHPTEYNPRKLNKKQQADLTKSLEKFDLVEIPAINTDNQVLAGHQRIKILSVLGRGNEEIDVRVPDRLLSKEEADEYVIRSNKNVGDWDLEKLTEAFNLDDLKDWGFEDFELGKFDIKLGNTDPDALPESVSPITAPGDLWILGDHRLICGDSADHDTVIKVMGTDLATCIVTDPPYGVSIAKKNVFLNEHDKGSSERITSDIVDDDLSPEELKSKLLPVFAELKNSVMAEDCTLFVCSPQGGSLGLMFLLLLKEIGLQVRHILIWKKNKATFSVGRLDYDYQHEPVLLTWGKKHKRPMLGEHRTSVWEIDRPDASKLHPTMKPVALYVNAYLNNSDSGDVVFDPYAGSGTVFISAEQTGRKARGIEISPHYCDIILNRYHEFTGVEPIRQDGVKFAEAK
jgi:DNA modification methylase